MWPSAFQEAAVDVLATKTMRAVEETGCRRVLLGGGVSANAAAPGGDHGQVGIGGRAFRLFAPAFHGQWGHGGPGGLFPAEQGRCGASPCLRQREPPLPGPVSATAGWIR